MSVSDPLGAELDDGVRGLGDIKRRTAHEEVRERLRVAILRGDLSPGSPLVFADLAEQLGTSRTPVREAIRDLVTEGLVDFNAYKSPVVHRPTLEEAREIYQLRLLLEAQAARECVGRLSEAQLAEADRLSQAIEGTSDVGRWAELNRRFHALLLEPVPSRRLRVLLDGLRDASALQVAVAISDSPARIREGNADHRALVEAFRAEDADEVERITRKHLLDTLESVETYWAGL